MAAVGGFITLHRKILEWEWYKNPNTFRLFLHIILMANYCDSKFEGMDVKRGQLVTSLPSLSVQTSLSVRQVRVALDHLILTGELTSKTYPKYRVITVVKYNDYQDVDSQDDSQMTAKRQANDSQMTGKRQQYNNNNNNNNDNKDNNNNPPLKRREVFKPPTVADVEEFCAWKGINGFDAQKFVDYYESVGWVVGKNKTKMKDWQATIRTWIRKDKERERERMRQEYDLPY